MQSNVILQKKKRGDNFGYLFILYSDGKKKTEEIFKQKNDRR